MSLQIGTYQMALCSKAYNKPFYVVAESFKFVRLYPLNQQDVPDKFKVWLRSGTQMSLSTLRPRTLFSLSFAVQGRHPENGPEPVRGTSAG